MLYLYCVKAGSSQSIIRVESSPVRACIEVFRSLGGRLAASRGLAVHVLQLVLGIDVLADVTLSDERDAVSRGLRERTR